MKVKVLGKDNKETFVEARSIEIDGRTLSSVLRDFRTETDKFKAFKIAYDKEQKELLKQWKRLK